MDETANVHTKSSRGGRVGYIEPVSPASDLCLGIDIGSTSSDIVVLDSTGTVVWSDYQRTRGRPLQTVRAQLSELFHTVSPARLKLSAATGSAGRFFAELVAIPFINEVAAQATAIAHLYPNLSQASVIEMGGQDSKLFFLVSGNTRLRVRDFSLNTVCAAGTGSFLDQQADRLGVSIEREFGQLALQSTSVPRMAGRCSVFAKSDMIHLQQQATPVCDILAGLCLALARNLKSNLGCGRQFRKPIIFTGGVAANVGVVRALENVFELELDELLIPQQHFFTGAIGAALVTRARAAQAGDGHPLQLELLDRYLADKRAALQSAPRRQPLTTPTLPPPASPLFEHLLNQAERSIDAYLGVDVGSLSTNVVVMNRQRRILAKAYLMTAGRPLEAVKQGLDLVGRKVQGKVKILGAATTGSGRYLTGDFIGADIVINEITAQAAGAAIVNPNVDTIFEIGGQDSKYISLENGVVVDFEMNHACAAGTGSFLEEQAQRLGIKIDKEFAALAFKSDHPIKLGERCTVFMESDLLSYQQQGAKVEDLVAGLSYSIVANYLNRVVGRRKIGKNICFQGGTAFNHAVWAAFEKVLAKPIMVPDHHEVTGALGAASIAAEHMDKIEAQTGRPPASTFRGFSNLISVEYTVESFTCEHCANHCEVKKVQLPGAPPLYYGSRCDRYNLSKKQRKAETFDAFDFRNRLLLECAGLDERALAGPAEPSKKPTIGIPLALVYWQLLPLFAQFFRALGFGVVLSGKTDRRILRMGIESVTAQPCFPVKVAFGHVVQLMASNVDYIFWPSIVSMTNQFQENQHNQLCPYVQSFGYLAQSAFGDHNGRPNGPRLLTVPLRLGEGGRLLRKSFAAIVKRLGAPQTKLRRALKQGLAAQHKFDQAMKEKGKELLAHLGPHDKLFVLVSRPYNGCDDGTNLRLPRKLTDLGAKIIPMEMLNLDQVELTEPKLHRQVYWSYGQKILRAAEIIKRDPRLFAIYLSNFSCGPDSFLLTFLKDIMGDKPCLQLEIDEHSADAGVITRLEAFLESLRNYRPQRQTRPQRPPQIARSQAVGPRRTLYIPYMGDSAYGVAACLTGYGQPAEVIPLADEAALLKGREFTSGKECLPCAITAGDMLKLLSTDGFDARRAAFFMPSAQGPCRFGMYNCLHQLILKYAGRPDVPVLAPNQDSSFYDELTTIFDGAGQAGFMRDLWTAIVGIDLLHKVVLRIRPFAKDPRHAQQLYEKLRTQWVQAVERRQPLSELIQLMAAFTDYLAAVDIDRLQPKPRIGIVGEIYVRSHPFANRNLVARLEQFGAACDLAPLAEWIYYTNLTRGRMARRRRQLRNFVTNTLQNYFQHKIEKALAEPLERKFGELAEQPVQDVLHLARPYLHDSFEGEAILSIGKTVEYHHQGFGGVINVMPFSCMPSTIVSAQTRRVSADCDDMPILNISFDGQEDPTLTTRLEAFVDQIRQRQYGNVTAVQVMAAGK